MLNASLELLANTLTQAKISDIEKMNINKFGTIAKSDEVTHIHSMKKFRKPSFFMKKLSTTRM